jgi:hypothetical protein
LRPSSSIACHDRGTRTAALEEFEPDGFRRPLVLDERLARLALGSQSEASPSRSASAAPFGLDGEPSVTGGARVVRVAPGSSSSINDGYQCRRAATAYGRVTKPTWVHGFFAPLFLIRGLLFFISMVPYVQPQKSIPRLF